MDQRFTLAMNVLGRDDDPFMLRFNAALKVFIDEENKEQQSQAFLRFAKSRNIVPYQLAMDLHIEMHAGEYTNENLLIEMESVAFQVITNLEPT